MTEQAQPIDRSIHDRILERRRIAATSRFDRPKKTRNRLRGPAISIVVVALISLLILIQIGMANNYQTSITSSGTIGKGHGFILSQSGSMYNAYFLENNTLFESKSNLDSVVSDTIAQLENGGEVDFRLGVYKSSGSWKINNENIILIGDSGTIVDFQTLQPTNSKSSGIMITSDGVTVQGFHLKNCDGPGIKARDANNLTIRNNKISNTWSGIVLESVNNTIVDHNDINLTQGDGIYVTGDPSTDGNSSHITVSNNRVLQVGDTGIDVSNGPSQTTYEYIDLLNNTIDDYNAASQTSTPNRQGITIAPETNGFEVSENTILDMKQGAYINGFNGAVNGNKIINFLVGSGIWAHYGNFTNSNVTLQSNHIFSSSASNGISTNKAWVIQNNKITVGNLDGDSAVYAPNAIVLNNTAYS